ncbi:glycosyl transferase, family 1 [Artemisia annua]|uniref:Glycosyl transferase, family 1 n=1 Tax=Artemisia annua TaxID=35608 RepID=A0A2U1P6H1_ARTAN|nr:glycosyl transferase, family 1 [Artemisia annua]
MGSLENGLLPLKRESLLKSLSKNERNNSFGQQRANGSRSRFARFMVLKKLDYLQWISAVAVFIFFMFVFQLFLPISSMEKASGSEFLRQESGGGDERLDSLIKEIGGLDFGEGVKFEPSKLLSKFHKDNNRVVRFGYRKPHLAFVFADLLVDPQQVLMVTVASALRAIGYEIEVYSLEDGPVHAVWKNIGVPVSIVEASNDTKIIIDWLNYDAILVNSLEAKDVISSLVQEPFKSLPLVWTIHEKTLATLFTSYISDGKIQLIDDWKATFNRATVVVFPNHAFPMYYAAFDAGNYFVIPGSPSGACKLDNSTIVLEESMRVNMNIEARDFVIVITGSQFLYKGIWVEHALVLQALSPLLAEFPADDSSSQRLKIIILSQDLTGNYSAALEEIASNLNYPSGTVHHAAMNEDVYNVLDIADLVIYGSFLEEQSFPDILIKAMCFEKPIVAPDLSIIKKYVDDNVNGYLFPKENTKALTQIMLQLVSKGRLSSLARDIASKGKHTAKNMMVMESVEGYASLIENVINLPSEVASPKAVSEIPSNIKTEWQWRFFKAVADRKYVNRTSRVYHFLNKVENRRNRTLKESSDGIQTNETFLYSIWAEEKSLQTAVAKKRREDGELRDRSEQPRGTWDDVYRSAKRADRNRNDLHERDDGELERTGQPLCIYEPYYGQGAWPFLHHGPLYRGFGLSTKGRRSKIDDIDGPSRLPLLSIPYYRDALGDFGAFFSIANRIDRIHKNAWIGFSSWRATAKKASLSRTAEVALLDDIQARRHGDALYFWVRMDKDPRNPMQQDFWTFCDAINAGNCKSAFSEALKKMYGVKDNSTSLPPMPVDGDSWSVMHSWSMPTKSFLEFVMFSRMFVDALDAQYYEEHHQSGLCYLSLSKDKHCYSRLLELLVNVWAYHSARRMVYIDPETGTIQEQHNFKSRRGKMWIKWFNYKTLKAMDEDLAEEADSDRHKQHWLWPSTGEVFWQGMYERERSQMRRQKEKRKQKSKDKIQRIKNRTHQKVIGKYVKPPPDNETVNNSNPTVEAAKLLR